MEREVGPAKLRSGGVLCACLVVALGMTAHAAFLEAPAPVAANPTLDADRNRIADDLDRKMADEPADALERIVVVLRAAPTPETVRQLKETLGPFLVTSAKEHRSDAEGRPWTIIPGFAATMTKRQVGQLAGDPDVSMVHGSGEVHLHLDTAREEMGVRDAWEDFDVFGDAEDDTVFHKDYDKADVTICVIDSGIDKLHPDLDDGQVIGWKDFVNDQPEAYDDHVESHGTYVASIAAGQGDQDPAYRGVAPGASLVGVKVVDAAGQAPPDPPDPNPFATVVNGIDWCVANMTTYGIDIINASLGGFKCTVDSEDPLSLAAEAAVAAGIVFVAAAGNDGPIECSIQPPGSATSVLAVGMMGDPDNACPPTTTSPSGGWYLYAQSSRGPTLDGRHKPDLVAPGLCIRAARSDPLGQNFYQTGSGTSAASPFVAGIAALLLDANPGWAGDPSAVRNALSSTAEPWGPSLQAQQPKNFDYGAGRVQAYQAVQQACGGCPGGGPPPVPTHFFRGGSLADNQGATDVYELTVAAGEAWPVTGVLLEPHAATYDFNLALRDPWGHIVDLSSSPQRQETVVSQLTPPPGTYRIEVSRVTGSGEYWLDVSADASALDLVQDG